MKLIKMKLMKHRMILMMVAALSSELIAGNWAQWRGPNFNGSTSEKGLPADWSKTEKVLWRASLPGESAATPIVWEDRVFVSSIDSKTRSLLAICLDRKDGSQLWSHVIHKGQTRQDDRSNFASPSPATDGRHVIFFYGNGDLVSFDLFGRQLWKRNIQKELGEFAFQWTFSASPLLFEGRLYLQVLQRNVPVRGRGFSDRPNLSYLLAMEPETGKTLWQHIRPSKAKAESLESFATPVPFSFQGKSQILIVGGDVLTGHDPKTGTELWRWGTWNPKRIGHWRHVPSPVFGEGIVLVCAPKRDPIYAIHAGGKGLLNDESIAWVSREVRELSSDVPTPAFYEGDFFILSDVRKAISRVSPKGKVKWMTELPGRYKYEASPLLADDKVFLMNFAGNVLVLNSKNGVILNQIKMGNEDDNHTRSSLIAAHRQLFIRTHSALFCISK